MDEIKAKVSYNLNTSNLRQIEISILAVRLNRGLFNLWLILVIDAIIINRSLSPPYEYIEGGDFRETLNLDFGG